MENLILIGSAVIAVAMIVGVFVMIKDQTAPIGPPAGRQPQPNSGRAQLESDTTAGAKAQPVEVSALPSTGAALLNEQIEEIGRDLGAERKIEALKLVRDLLQQGKKLEAVNAWRDATGLAEQEALAAIEAMET